MSVVTHLESFEFYQLMREGLDEEVLSTEEVIRALIFHECDLFANVALILEDIMQIIERHK
jgi:hypothetical protein